MNFAPYCVEDLGTLELAIVSPETTLIDCAKKMHDLRVSSLIVASTSDGSAGPWLPQGILTDRDIVLEAVAFLMFSTLASRSTPWVL